MNEWIIALMIGLACGLLLGIRIARESNKKQPVLGGLLAQVLHYLACAGMTSVLPFVVAGIVIGLSFLVLIGTGISLLAVTFGLLVLYALIERGASRHQAARS